MSGAFKTGGLDAITNAITPTTRLLLTNQERHLAAALSAMTCVHGGMELYNKKSSLLGPDPLRPDAGKKKGVTG